MDVHRRRHAKMPLGILTGGMYRPGRGSEESWESKTNNENVLLSRRRGGFLHVSGTSEGSKDNPIPAIASRYCVAVYHFQPKSVRCGEVESFHGSDEISCENVPGVVRSGAQYKLPHSSHVECLRDGLCTNALPSS